jgi:hypothetical protein
MGTSLVLRSILWKKLNGMFVLESWVKDLTRSLRRIFNLQACGIFTNVFNRFCLCSCSGCWCTRFCFVWLYLVELCEMVLQNLFCFSFSCRAVRVVSCSLALCVVWTSLLVCMFFGERIFLLHNNLKYNFVMRNSGHKLY